MKPVLRFPSINSLRVSYLDAEREYIGVNQRLSTLFQVNLEIIKIMRSKNFSFGFTENINKFIILRRDIGKVRNLCKLCEVSLDV